MAKRSAQPDLDLVPLIDWARLAAYIDGEGCIRIASVRGARNWSRRVMYVELTITNTDVRLVEWLRTNFGGAICKNSGNARKANWSPAFAWYVTSRRASQIIEGALPYFVIKREQADVALAFQRTIITDRRYGCKGRPAALLDQQDGLRDQLQSLKGTSGGRRESSTPSTH